MSKTHTVGRSQSQAHSWPYPTLLAGLGLGHLLDGARVNLLHLGAVQCHVRLGNRHIQHPVSMLLILKPTSVPHDKTRGRVRIEPNLQSRARVARGGGGCTRWAGRPGRWWCSD
jgi:hypothetical protein